MKIELRHYQEEAVNQIRAFFKSDSDKAKMYISVGLGKSTIIVSATQALLTEQREAHIVLLTSTCMIRDQIKSLLHSFDADISVAISAQEFSSQRVLITTYRDVEENRFQPSTFDLVICDDAQRLRSDDCAGLLVNGKGKFLGILEGHESSENWFYGAQCLFSYTMGDAMKDGYAVQPGEREFIEPFLIRLLEHQGYKNICTEARILDDASRIRPDIVAEMDGKQVILEVKSYRNLYNSRAIINNAIKQVLRYKFLTEKANKVFSFIVVLPCEVEDDVKREIYERYEVVIWDISNLIYLCEGSRDLIQLLQRSLPYPAVKLEAKKPLGWDSIKHDSIDSKTERSPSDVYMERLEHCKPGKADNADKEYESICTDIIKYLFETEFYKISEQHKTGDEMFRMDLLCSLKGSTAFWKFLISFYRTKFVVFEYKNYSEPISQNLIYITEKYLFPVALRNVAFIISRKGFDQNAEKAALGCLRESGKLIVSLDDDDLISMLVMKKTGEEPSDYLLDKIELLLMSVSK